MTLIKSRSCIFALVVILFLHIAKVSGEVVIQDVLWTRDYDEEFGENYFGTCRFVQTPCGLDNSGVCVPSGRCYSQGGWSHGYTDCGGGLGECCQFVESCSAERNQIDIKELVTTIQSPYHYSNKLDACSFRFRKDSTICQIRLDFLQFESVGADDNGICNVDKLKIRNSATVERDFTTCGNLNGQHMYLTFGSEDTIEVIPQLKSENSYYHIVATKIPCNSRARVPAHCLQYFNGSSGTVTSFDYPNQQQSNQKYTICVKPDPRSTSIEWTTCDYVPQTFNIITPPPYEGKAVCSTDWVQAKGLEKTCEPFTSLTTTWKSYELMVNFDEQEYPPPPPSFSVGPPPGSTPATCETACNGLSMPPAYTCGCNSVDDLSCVCISGSAGGGSPPVQVDFNNTGCCLGYTQKM